MARLRSLSEMFAQPRNRIANLFRESRIDILDIGQKTAAYVFDLLQGQPGLFDLSDCAIMTPASAPITLPAKLLKAPLDRAVSLSPTSKTAATSQKQSPMQSERLRDGASKVGIKCTWT